MATSVSAGAPAPAGEGDLAPTLVTSKIGVAAPPQKIPGQIVEHSAPLPDDLRTALCNPVQNKLSVLSKRGEVDAVKAMLQTQEGVDSLEWTDRNGWTALFHAVFKGYQPIVEALLDAGANIDHRNARRQNALHIAIEHNHTTIVKLLLEEGIKGRYDIVSKIRNKTGKDVDPEIEALVFQSFPPPANVPVSAYFKQTQAPSKALAAAAKKDYWADNAPLNVLLYNAAKKSNLEEVKGILSYHANKTSEFVNWRDKNGSTALFHCAWSGNIDIARELVRHHADVNVTNLRLNTPLHLAIEKNHFALIKYFLEQGADTGPVDVQEIRKRTGRKISKKIDKLIAKYPPLTNQQKELMRIYIRSGVGAKAGEIRRKSHTGSILQVDVDPEKVKNGGARVRRPRQAIIEEKDEFDDDDDDDDDEDVEVDADELGMVVDEEDEFYASANKTEKRAHTRAQNSPGPPVLHTPTPSVATVAPPELSVSRVPSNTSTKSGDGKEASLKPVPLTPSPSTITTVSNAAVTSSVVANAVPAALPRAHAPVRGVLIPKLANPPDAWMEKYTCAAMHQWLEGQGLEDIAERVGKTGVDGFVALRMSKMDWLESFGLSQMQVDKLEERLSCMRRQYMNYTSVETWDWAQSLIWARAAAADFAEHEALTALCDAFDKRRLSGVELLTMNEAELEEMLANTAAASLVPKLWNALYRLQQQEALKAAIAGKPALYRAQKGSPRKRDADAASDGTDDEEFEPETPKARNSNVNNLPVLKTDGSTNFKGFALNAKPKPGETVEQMIERLAREAQAEADAEALRKGGKVKTMIVRIRDNESFLKGLYRILRCKGNEDSRPSSQSGSRRNSVLQPSSQSGSRRNSVLQRTVEGSPYALPAVGRRSSVTSQTQTPGQNSQPNTAKSGERRGSHLPLLLNTGAAVLNGHAAKTPEKPSSPVHNRSTSPKSPQPPSSPKPTTDKTNPTMGPNKERRVSRSINPYKPALANAEDAAKTLRTFVSSQSPRVKAQAPEPARRTSIIHLQIETNDTPTSAKSGSNSPRVFDSSLSPRKGFLSDEHKAKLTWIFEDIDKYGTEELQLNNLVEFNRFINPKISDLTARKDAQDFLRILDVAKTGTVTLACWMRAWRNVAETIGLQQIETFIMDYVTALERAMPASPANPSYRHHRIKTASGLAITHEAAPAS